MEVQEALVTGSASRWEGHPCNRVCPRSPLPPGPGKATALTQRDLSATIPRRVGPELVSSSIRQINVMPLAQGRGRDGQPAKCREPGVGTVTCGAL